MDFYQPPSRQGLLDALGGVYRALRAWRFYPQGHPTRKKSVRQSHLAMLQVLDGHDLSLTCGRSGFTLPDGEVLRDSTRMSAALSYELFIRRVQKIVFLGDLYQEDLLGCLRLLSLTPDAIYKAGGFDKLAEELGIRTIWVNEFDLSRIQTKRLMVEATGVVPQGLDEIETGIVHDSAAMDEQATTAALDPEQELSILLGRLVATADEDVYLMLVRQAVAVSDVLKAHGELPPLIPLAELLASQSKDARLSGNLTECARFGLEQLAMGDEFLAFLLDRMESTNDVTKDAILAVLSAAGPAAIGMVVEKAGATDNLAFRKMLTLLLTKLGDQAVPVLMTMLGDSRWFIVRNLVTILGEIGSVEAVPELQKCLQHSDIRVCKEAIRSLAKIGGKEAESAILAVLRSSDASLLPQAIASLGGMKSRRALVELLHIICSEDMFLNGLALKTEALAAIALIGDRQVTPRLLDLLESRHLVARSRWMQFKIAIAVCLGKLGDSRAVPVLRKKASGSGELGRACAEAADLIEQRTGGDSHGGA